MTETQQLRKKPELLAPAGSLEAFFAAMEKGADAVYAGLKEFSARAKAKNFSLAQMERMLAYAHGEGRKIYVTINTLVKEQELPLLIDTLASLEAMGVDGVIIQDLAVARIARRFFPAIPLHASTQMTVHNSPGVRQLAELGFQRVVLARELHLDEIREIVRTSTIGIECFIHGALCFSLSGQCYFSSFLGGHSGNRGRCAQPCRRQYRYRGKEGYYFSTNDFSSIELIPQLVTAGVESLKIEGRMKSAEYVASVVGAYRKVLDAPPKEWPDALTEAKELLKLSFGRVPTKGFLASQQPTDIATPSLRGATGRFLGEIRAIKGGRILFESRDRLHIGDRIRVQPKSDLAGKAFTVKELFQGNRQVKATSEKARVEIPAPFSCTVGDAVFKVSSETAFTLSESACQRRLEGVRAGKFPCDLTVTWQEGRLVVDALVCGIASQQQFDVGPLDPARSSDMAAVLAGQFGKTGDTRFTLRTLEAPAFPPLLIPATLLKEVRRDFYQRLADEVLPAVARERQERVRQARGALVQGRPVSGSARTELIVRVDHLKDLNLLHQQGVDAVSLPVSRANLHQLPQTVRRLKGREGKIIWRLPFIIFEQDTDWYRDAIAYLAGIGFSRFEAANISHFPLLTGIDAELSTDYRLFSVNSQAIQAWQDLGASAVTLYLEDDAENLAELLAADLGVTRRILVYGSVPVITSKIAIKGVRGDVPLLSDRGDGYRVTVKDGLTVVTATTPFSITGFRERLQGMGCSSFVIDLGQTPADQWPRVLDAFSRSSELPGTSPFNFATGLV